jgi:hypothetical protein
MARAGPTRANTAIPHQSPHCICMDQTSWDSMTARTGPLTWVGATGFEPATPRL